VLHLAAIKASDESAIMRATRSVDENDESQKRAEWEANWFAAAFLMPREQFSDIFKTGGLSAVQDVFDVSSAAATTRARSLGLIE
jgi:Zn-dependent peptidase ImmA (M78 family)